MEENLENVSKNNKIKIIFAFIGVFIVFYVCFYYMTEIAPLKLNAWGIYNPNNKINYFYEIYKLFKSLICFFMHYLPTFLLLKYIFKKTESTKKRMWSVALALPLTSLFYFIIHILVSLLPVYDAKAWYELWFTDWFFMETIGMTVLHFEFLLCCLLPSVILTSLIIPKKYLPIRSEICKTSLLTLAVCISPFVIFVILLVLISKNLT